MAKKVRVAERLARALRIQTRARGRLHALRRLQATLFRKQVEQNDKVCPECNHHFSVSATERIAQLLDPDTYEDWFSGLQPADPLGFDDRRPYPERIKAEQERTGLKEAALVGQGFIKGIRIVLGITDSSFIMGSHGLGRRREAHPRHRGGHPPEAAAGDRLGIGRRGPDARRHLFADADGQGVDRPWALSQSPAASTSAF